MYVITQRVHIHVYRSAYFHLYIEKTHVFTLKKVTN